VPPSVSDIEDQPTHDAYLPGFHHGTYPRCLFTRFSPLDEGISLCFFDFLIFDFFFFFAFFLIFFAFLLLFFNFLLLDGLTITHGACLPGFHHHNG